MIAVRESPQRNVQLWPIERLVPYARNPRTHSEEQVTQIAASIAEFGFTNPILVDSQAGIIAGHGRLVWDWSRGWRNEHDAGGGGARCKQIRDSGSMERSVSMRLRKGISVDAPTERTEL